MSVSYSDLAKAPTVCVGGAPAAVTAMQLAIDNESVIYVNPDKHVAVFLLARFYMVNIVFLPMDLLSLMGPNQLVILKLKIKASINPPRAEDSGKPGIRWRKNVGLKS